LNSTIFKHDVRLYTSPENTGDYLISEIERAVAAKPSYLWIHFSGHGQQVSDQSHDELDGIDEAIVIGDHQSVTLTDDQLASMMKRLTRHTKLLFTSDSCHSGSILDLPYIHKYDADTQSHSSILEHYEMGTASMVCLSGCQDAQYSYETASFGVSGGQFTRSLSSYLSECDDMNTIHLISLLHYMGQEFATRKQHPVLSTNFPLYDNTTFF